MDTNQKFDEATQRELQTFIEQEQAKARVQATTHQLTDMCWTKCITGSVSTRFSSSEAYCLQNCVDRFLDTSLFIVKKLDEQRRSMQGGQ
ncbi:unnamed protein product [Rhizoctonia solani]|uniref:Mitochondrial import inner membrane translocase subunit n=3 Tax=Rhizoctonia solani TaxID=456999 RepID=A0A8H3A213_9AGAM|nr:import inner membrane translocase subunit TIM8 [Rhizoctonia solani AG-3 Rhs1AP]KEP53818.1 import inner membrane translocase subunit TIM8 [Rhizoctonia solani 123E]CAE6377820.1 unnamed protein product [Rhizoctonia solani]CAE6413240.1 unnamed protein product [Rhizoctonia solani]CAE6437828.1 unnamed protein product [Rhizoctonia solani]